MCNCQEMIISRDCIFLNHKSHNHITSQSDKAADHVITGLRRGRFAIIWNLIPAGIGRIVDDGMECITHCVAPTHSTLTLTPPLPQLSHSVITHSLFYLSII